MVEFNQLAGVAVIFVLAGIILTMGGLIGAEVQDEILDLGDPGQEAGNSTQLNVSRNANAGMFELTSWFPLMAIVIAAVLIITLLIKGFSGGKIGR